MVAKAEGGAGKRRPQEEDLDPILELIWQGKSLNAACDILELHVPSTSDWLWADQGVAGGRCEQYARAREGRAEYLQEDAITVNRAAALGVLVNGKKVDASGARGYGDIVKWATARMAPKTAPVERLAVTHEFGGLSDEDLDARIDAKLGKQAPDERSADET